MIRHASDFENYAIGARYGEMSYSGTCQISEINGKKVAKGIGSPDYITQKYNQANSYSNTCNLKWAVGKIYARLDPGADNGIQNIKAIWSTGHILGNMYISTADANKVKWTVYCIKAGVGSITYSGLLNVTADGQFHDLEMRIGLSSVYIRCDSESSTQAIGASYQPATIGYVEHAWGQSYTAYKDTHILENDIYGEADSSKLLIDGLGVAGVTVKLWDTTLAPPTKEITTGTGGSLDFSGVDDGVYDMGAVDLRGYCVFAEDVEISSGEVV